MWKPLGEKPIQLLAVAHGVGVGGKRRVLPLHRAPVAPIERFGNSTPPSATGSMLSPLSAPLYTASGSCSPVRFSPLNKAGVETPGLLQLAYQVRAVRDLHEPSKKLQQR